MTAENEERRPRSRFSDAGQENENQREKRPNQPYYRSDYGNGNTYGNNYNRSENNYEGGSRNNYERSGQGYDRTRNSNQYNSRPNNYRNEGGSDSRFQRPYNNNYQQRQYEPQQRQYDTPRYNDNRPETDENGAAVKKRRPRVSEVPAPARSSGNYNRPQGQGYQGDSRGDSRGGYPQQRQISRYSQGNQGGNNRNYQNNREGYNRNENNRDNYDPNAKYSVKKQLKYREEHFDPNEPIRLNKYLANAGVCSRREADQFIIAGLVKVNDETVTTLGTKVKRSDTVSFHNEPVKLEQKVYVLLNKPKNCVTTAEDPQERLTVMDLVKSSCQERIFPVGRLDRNTTGVLLLTNDGDLASKLTHPKFLKKKIYHVWLDKNVSIADMQKIAEGIELEDGEIHADAISYVTETDKDQVGVEIHSGRNRVVRRMFESLGYHVIKLDRVYFAGLTKKNLKRGQWRYLSEKEVSMLRMGAFD
jgi:23S rRNA pseudouridine2605 synthase